MMHFINISDIPNYPNTCNVTRLPTHKKDTAERIIDELHLRTKVASEMIGRLTRNPEQIAPETTEIASVIGTLDKLRYSLQDLYKGHFAPMELKKLFLHSQLTISLLHTLRSYHE